MKAAQLAAIRERLEAAPTEFVPRVHTYGTVVVMISCANERQAKALAEILSHARSDIEALLGDVTPEPVQATMELFDGV
jgi:hypothetical protein